MFQPDATGVYARVQATPMRRGAAVGMLYILGALLIVLVFRNPPSASFAVIMGLMGAISFWQGERLRKATKLVLELTSDELRDSDGRCLAKVADIKSVDRGVFAFKPSNGFVLHLKVRTTNAWAPGLWWRLGRKVGVGGVVPSGQAKYMAEVISTWIALRD